MKIEDRLLYTDQLATMALQATIGDRVLYTGPVTTMALQARNWLAMITSVNLNGSVDLVIFPPKALPTFENDVDIKRLTMVGRT